MKDTKKSVSNFGMIFGNPDYKKNSNFPTFVRLLFLIKFFMYSF